MKHYFYKIKDIDDDKYNYYISTDKECGEIIEKGMDTYEEEREDNVIYYIIEEFDKAGIDYEIIDFIEYEY